MFPTTEYQPDLKNNKKSFYDKFNEFENSLLIFEDKEMVEYWYAVRYSIYNTILSKLKINDKAHTSPININELKHFNLLKFIGKMLKQSFERNPFFSNKETNYLILGHPRRKLEKDGFYWDIYSDPIIDNFIGHKERFLVLEHAQRWSHYKPPKTKNLYYLDSILLNSYIRKNVKKFSIDSIVFTYGKNIENEISREFNVYVPVTQMLISVIKKYKSSKKLYSKLIKKFNPEIVFIVCSYGKEIFIEAAKDLNKPVVELQHGIITPYHVGYDYRNGKTKKNFPDYLLTFGPKWKMMANFPIPQERIIPVGFPYLEMKKKEYTNITKKDQILFISQGTIGKELSQFAVKLAKKNHHIKVIYKLHPGELAKWKHDYHELAEAEKLNCIDVIEGFKPSLYQLFAESKWQIGVYSTALFEGLAFYCTTYIVNLPGAEYMDSLISAGTVKLVNSPDDVDFSSADHNFNVEDYFTSNWQVNFKNAIDFITTDYYSRGDKTT